MHEATLCRLLLVSVSAVAMRMYSMHKPRLSPLGALQIQHPHMHTWDVSWLQRLELGGVKVVLMTYDGLRLSGSLMRTRPVRRGVGGEALSEAEQEVIM